MHDADVVRRLERARHLLDDPRRTPRRQRALALEQRGERLPIHELHGEVDEAVRRLPEVVDRGDVRVRDLARVLRLAIEAHDGVGVVHHAGVEHLHGALPLHAHVLGEVHLPHAALSELAHDEVAVGDHEADEVGPSLGAKAGAITRAESLVAVVGGAALRADLAQPELREVVRRGIRPLRRTS